MENIVILGSGGFAREVAFLIEEINKAAKKYSWKEIKEKLKGHKIIKEINPKDKTIVLEL